MLLGDRMTVSGIREVAARMQCETVLVYGAVARRDYRYRVFRRDEARALITVEAVVLHTRTGILPFSFVVDRDVELKGERGETSFDLWERARTETLESVLGDVGEQVAAALP